MNRRPPTRRPQSAPQQPQQPRRPGHHWPRNYWYPYHWYHDYDYDYDYYDYYDNDDLYDYYYHFNRYDASADDFARGFQAGLKQAKRDFESNEQSKGYTGSHSAAGYCGSMGA